MRKGDIQIHAPTGVNDATIVDLRINETLKTGAVGKAHLPGDESVYLFLVFTIILRAGQDASPTM